MARRPYVRVLIRDWRVVASSESTLHLRGVIFGHLKFKDGSDVVTSEIKGFNPERQEIRTRNTTYLAEGFDMSQLEIEVKL